MIEFLVGIAIGAVLMGAWTYAMWREDRAERRSVPVPESLESNEPVEGERWVLRGVTDALTVTVCAVCAGLVFFAYEGTGTRSLKAADFVRLYRRAP